MLIVRGPSARSAASLPVVVGEKPLLMPDSVLAFVLANPNIIYSMLVLSLLFLPPSLPSSSPRFLSSQMQGSLPRTPDLLFFESSSFFHPKRSYLGEWNQTRSKLLPLRPLLNRIIPKRLSYPHTEGSIVSKPVHPHPLAVLSHLRWPSSQKSPRTCWKKPGSRLGRWGSSSCQTT